MAGWQEIAERARARYRDGEARVGEAEDADVRQRQLTRLGNTAWAAGLALLAAGERKDAAPWLARAADRYRESWNGAPPGSWGRPIGAMKARLLAGDDAGEEARWALEAGAADADSPIGRYAATLALLVLGGDAEAATLATTLVGRDDFPSDVADAVAALAAHDRDAYAAAALAVLRSFEEREEFLEDVPLADTVLVLQALAAPRGIAARLPDSSLLP